MLGPHPDARAPGPRSMVLSRNSGQLRGDSTQGNVHEDCGPQTSQPVNGCASARAATRADPLRRVAASLTRAPTAALLPIMPCGLAAWTYFNDSYVFSVLGCAEQALNTRERAGLSLLPCTAERPAHRAAPRCRA